MNKIYITHPISGLTADEVFSYYEHTQSVLKGMNYDVYTPLFGKSFLRCEKEFRAEGYKQPCATNHAIFNRDHWYVINCDILYANFLSAKSVSIGSMMELAWANDHHKHVIVTMQRDNIHAHAFVYEAASIVYENHEEALNYLKMIKEKNF